MSKVMMEFFVSASLAQQGREWAHLLGALAVQEGAGRTPPPELCRENRAHVPSGEPATCRSRYERRAAAKPFPLGFACKQGGTVGYITHP